CRIAGQEMIQRLFRRESADGRQYAKGIASQEENVSRMVAFSRSLAVVDEIDGVGGAGVFRNAIIVELRPMRVRIDHHVFQDAAETDGVPDLWLALSRQPNGLGIAATLEVEDALVRPTMLVVADEPPLGIGRQRRLAGARQAEEERGIVARPDVGRAVHRKDA